ncbi:MAG: hypothetical protein WA724_09710 [Candidatus Dormiibacterota bacterium]
MRTGLSPSTRAALRDLRLRRRFPAGASCHRCGWGARTLARQLQGQGLLPARGLRTQSQRLELQAAAALTRRRRETLCYRCRSGRQTEFHHPAGRSAEPGWAYAIDSRLHRLVHALSGWQHFTPQLATQIPSWLRTASGFSIPGVSP